MPDLIVNSVIDTFMQAVDQAGMRSAMSLGALSTVGVDAGLDLVAGTPAQGDLIYRSASAYARVAAGTAGGLMYQGGGGTPAPAWSSKWTLATSGTMTVTGGSVATSTPLLNMSQTWNDAAGGTVTFAGIKLTITDTASAAASLPFQILGGAAGTTNLLKVDKSGTLTFGGSGGVGVLSVSATDVVRLQSGTTGSYLQFAPSSDPYIGIGNVSYSATWYVPASFVIEQRYSTNAQAYRLYKTYGSSTDYERAAFDWITVTDVFHLRTEVGSAGGTIRGMVVGAGAAVGNNINGANTTIVGGPGTGSGTPGSIVFQTATTPGGGSAGTAGTLTTRMTILPSGQVNIGAGGISDYGSGQLGIGGPSAANIYVTTNSLAVCSTLGSYRWTNGIGGTLTATIIGGEAGNATSHYLEQRNSTNAQTYNLYRTYGSTTSYERGASTWNRTADTWELRTEVGSAGGTIRGMVVGAGAAVGTNIAGANTTIVGGPGTGNAVGGSIVFQTAPVGSSGTTVQTLTDRMKITPAGNIHSAVSPTTGMTDGFIYIPGAAGAPTAAPPTAISGHIPVYYDTTNNKIYVYNGAWKSTAALT